MWLRRLLFKLKIQWITISYPLEHTNEQNLAYIKALDTDMLRSCSITNMCMYKFDTIYPNIQIYIEKIKLLNIYLSAGRTIENNWCKYNYSQTTMLDFLTKDNIYIDTKSALTEFKQEYIVYCEYILNTDKHEHNARILSLFSEHLRLITLCLLRYNCNV